MYRSDFNKSFSAQADRMLEIMKNSLLRSVELNRTMRSKVPSYKLKGLRVDKIFLANPKQNESRKKHKAERKEQARRSRARTMLTGKLPSQIILEESSSSSDAPRN